MSVDVESFTCKENKLTRPEEKRKKKPTVKPTQISFREVFNRNFLHCMYPIGQCAIKNCLKDSKAPAPMSF